MISFALMLLIHDGNGIQAINSTVQQFKLWVLDESAVSLKNRLVKNNKQ